MKLTPSDPLHGNIQEIMNAGRRSADLVRQLLAFARKQTITPVSLNLNDTVAPMLNMLQSLIGEDIDLLWKPAPDLWTVRVDPAQIDQVLANLAVNARDAIAGVGKVTIETGNMVFDAAYCSRHKGFVKGQFAMLAVSDDGCGMDKQTIDLLFEPFFTTKGVGKGTGLGLSTVYGIVKQNKGFINVYSEPGKGSTFKIYLPREESPGALTEERLQHPDQTPTGTETVMVVEDEAMVLEIAKTILEQLGYTVLTAAAPLDALNLAARYEGEIHLLVTDVVMPEMSGRDLWGGILSLRPKIKTLFMSGYTANAIAHHGVLDDGICFLQKPFSREALAVKIREALSA
jgi:CheY-like chemotaxis protein